MGDFVRRYMNICGTVLAEKETMRRIPPALVCRPDYFGDVGATNVRRYEI